MPESIAELLGSKLLGSPVSAYLAACGVFALILAAAYGMRRVILERLRALAGRTQTRLDDLAVEVLSSIRLPEFLLVALYVSSRGITINPSVDKVLRIALVVTLSVRAIRILQSIAAYGLAGDMETRPADPAGASALRNARWFVNAALWVGGGLFILDNLGINVTALMTGLGIGGVAVALAAQALLGDLFSSFSIMLDKPFSVGDFITVGEDKGTVEHIGVKTTRLRSLGGELLVLPNGHLTSSAIRNYGLMQRRRVAFSFGVTYQTPPEKLRRIPEIVRLQVAANQKATLDRAHFKGFGDSSLDFEVVYHVEHNDHNLYMDIQQRINLGLLEAFLREGIDFAYPTRTLLIQKDAASSRARDPSL